MSIPWDPVVQDRLTRLQLLSREIVWGLNTGQHRSTRVTRSVEFVEHKVYEPGDPISSLDWKVYARTDKLMVRRQSADTDSNVVFLLDASGDMQSTYTGDTENWTESKFGRALTAVAGLAQMADKRGDPVGLWIAGGDSVDTGLQGYIPPSQRSLRPLFHQLASVHSSGNASLHSHLTQLAVRLPRKSIIVIVSDWMEDPSLWGPALETLAAQGHDIRCLQLYSKVEWSLELPESIQVYSEEHAEKIPLDTPAMKDIWQQTVSDYRSEVQSWSGRSRSIWVEAAVEDELLPSLIQLVRGWR